MALTRITKGVIKPNENYDTHNINSTGIVTATGANITGNLTVGGVLTYEDVTSIDSVGIITAQKGIHVGAGISAVGVITASSFRGDGSQLTGIDATSLKDSGGNVKIQAQASGAVHTGVSTLGTSGSVFLEHNGTERLRTTTAGIRINNAAYIENNGSNIKVAGAGISNSIFHNGDENTAMDFSHDDRIRFRTNGTERLAITNGGVHINVGVTTIALELDVDGDLDVDGHTNLDNVSITGVTTFSHTGANQLVIKDSDTSGANSQQRISFRDSADTEMFFIGNNTTNSWLYLGSPSGQNNNIAFRVNGSDKFQVNGSGAYVNGDLTVNGTADILDSIIHTGDTNTKIRFPSNDNISFEVGGTERLRIDDVDGVVAKHTTAANLRVQNSTAAASQVATLDMAPANGLSGVQLKCTSEEDFSTGANRTAFFTLENRKDGTFYERLRIDSDGRTLFSRGGLTASRNIGTKTGEIQVANSANSSAITIMSYTNDVGGPHLVFGKSRAGNATGSTIVQNGDRLGEIAFCGADGNDIDSFGAAIKAHVDGTPGANDMPGRLEFYTTGDGGSTAVERLRISSTGAVQIGTGTGTGGGGLAIYGGTVNQSSGQDANLYIDARSAADWGIWLNKPGHEYGFRLDTITGATLAFAIYGGGSLKHQFKGNGDYVASGAVDSTSDIKLKTNIKTIDSALDKVLQLRGAEYDRIDKDNHHEIGVIAQEVEKVIPEVVHGDETKSVSYGNMVAVLIEAIKEQNDVINKMKKEIEDLKG